MKSQYWTFHKAILTIQYQSPPQIIWNGFGIFSILKYTAAVNNAYFGIFHSLHVSCYIVWIYNFLQERAVNVFHICGHVLDIFTYFTIWWGQPLSSIIYIWRSGSYTFASQRPVILSCYGHEIKQPIKFLVLIRTTDLIGPLIWWS